jgi:hypothetical protein
LTDERTMPTVPEQMARLESLGYDGYLCDCERVPVTTDTGKFMVMMYYFRKNGMWVLAI